MKISMANALVLSRPFGKFAEGLKILPYGVCRKRRGSAAYRLLHELLLRCLPIDI
jgi:hypothetical protein